MPGWVIVPHKIPSFSENSNVASQTHVYRQSGNEIREMAHFVLARVDGSCNCAVELDWRITRVREETTNKTLKFYP